MTAQMDLGIWSDTGEWNRSPITTMLPLLRYQKHFVVFIFVRVPGSSTQSFQFCIIIELSWTFLFCFGNLSVPHLPVLLRSLPVGTFETQVSLLASSCYTRTYITSSSKLIHWICNHGVPRGRCVFLLRSQMPTCCLLLFFVLFALDKCCALLTYLREALLNIGNSHNLLDFTIPPEH